MSCNGDDPACAECSGEGLFHLVGCPAEFVTADVWEAIRLTRFAERGHLPVAGGVLDQTAVWSDAMRFIQSEDREIDAARRKRPVD